MSAYCAECGGEAGYHETTCRHHGMGVRADERSALPRTIELAEGAIYKAKSKQPPDVEKWKLLIALRSNIQVGRTAEALHVLDRIEQMIRVENRPRGPNNYDVVDTATKMVLASGTREWCIGYAEARPGSVVACGDFVVHPNWGDEL